MLQFTQHEVEDGFAEILVHSDRVEISRRTGIGETIIKGMFNPDDERKSYAYCDLRVACALHDINARRGDAYVQQWLTFYELSKTRHCDGDCLDTETARFTKEAGDVPIARLDPSKTTKDQLRAVRESVAQGKHLEQILIDEIRKEDSNGSIPRIDVRAFAHRSVAKRRENK